MPVRLISHVFPRSTLNTILHVNQTTCHIQNVKLGFQQVIVNNTVHTVWLGDAISRWADGRKVAKGGQSSGFRVYF